MTDNMLLAGSFLITRLCSSDASAHYACHRVVLVSAIKNCLGMAPPLPIIGLSRLLLCLALPRVASWTAPLARVQGSARHSGPRMSGDRGDSLSSEFERLAAARAGTVFGCAAALLREHKVRGSWVLIFNEGQDDEGLYTLQGSEASGAQHEGTYVLAFEQLEEASRF